MPLKDDLANEVQNIFSYHWEVRRGKAAPGTESLTFGNEGVTLDATVLCADIFDSTAMVDALPAPMAAEIHKAYLYCAARLVRQEGGDVVAYEGDRILAIFLDGKRNTTAVTCGLKINWAVQNLINPALKANHPDKSFTLRHVVGIDAGELLAARAGVRGAHDLAWIGSAANHAAKLTQMDADFPIRITSTVYDRMADTVKVVGGQAIWEKRAWTAMKNRTIYKSSSALEL